MHPRLRLRRLPAPLLALAPALLAMAPGLAWALGLGGIRSDSALNEPFLGRIELNGIAPEELDAVRVTLASEAEFTKVGSPRPHFLSRLSFTPEVSPEGRLQIRVTSPEPIREPYLDFLVEVTWPQGRLVKGYTVLLDPPTTLNRPPPAVRAPQVAAPGVPAARPGGAALPSGASLRSGEASPWHREAPPRTGEASLPHGEMSVRPGEVEPRSAFAGAPAAVATPTGGGLEGGPRSSDGGGPATAAASLADLGPPPPGYPLRYGPVPKGAALATLARRMAPPGASQEQTALALFRANPQAFSGGNINRLKAGARLEIPHPALIFALEAKTARQQYLAAQKGQPLPPLPVLAASGATGVGPGDAPGDAPGVVPPSGSDRLEIATHHPAAAEGDGARPVAAAPSPSISTSTSPSTSPSPAATLVAAASPAVVPEGPFGPDLALVEREILLVREMAETGRQETTELRGRIDRLEAHLGDIKRLLEMSNAHLAELQRLGVGVRLDNFKASLPGSPEAPAPLTPEEAEPATPEARDEATVAATAQVPAAGAPGVPEVGLPETGAAGTLPPGGTKALEPLATAEPSSSPAVTAPVGAPVDQPAPLAREPAKQPAPRPPSPPPPPAPPESSFFDDISGWTLVVGGPLLALLLGLLLLVRRQNRVKPVPEAVSESPSAAPPEAAVKKEGWLKRQFSWDRSATAEMPAAPGWLNQRLARWRERQTELSASLDWRGQLTQLAAKFRKEPRWRTAPVESPPSTGWREQLPQWMAKFRKVPLPFVPRPAGPEEASPGEAGPLPHPALTAPVALAGLAALHPASLQPAPGPGTTSVQEWERVYDQDQEKEQPPASPVALEVSSLSSENETREALSLPPLSGDLEGRGRADEAGVGVNVAGIRDLESISDLEATSAQDVAAEEAVLAALDLTLREPEPSPSPSRPLQTSQPPESLHSPRPSQPPQPSQPSQPAQPPQPPQQALGELDLGDLLELSPLAPTTGGSGSPPQPSPDAPELDLSDLEGLDLGAALGLTPAPSPAAGVGGTAGLMGDRASAGAGQPEQQAEETMMGQGQGQGLELDLSDLLDLDLDLSVLSAPEAATPPAPTAAAFTAESAAASFTALSAIPADTSPSALAPATTEDESRLALDFDQEPESWDEVGIKLDLARAYLQMDDPEAARTLLVEILTEGTEEQIAQAKTLLARLE